ncbi:MAG: hypothetical protein K2I96_00280 [Lachnospiraceae bacterium]|nr:hypothetical protein [Lachnospiraceae bacterium]
MKKMFVMVLKVLGVIVLILVISITVLLAAAPLVNDHVAEKTVKKLVDLPLPENTEYIESVCKAGKLIGCGNGMQYFGAILIQSELSYEELAAYYSNFAEHDWECVVENQVSAEIRIAGEGVTFFSTDVEGDNYYIVYSWGSNKTIFHGFDIRGH